MTYEQIKQSKQSLTKLQKFRLNTIYSRLIIGQVTKKELMQLIQADERTVRDCISYIKKFYPVISLSGEKGYRIAKSKEDLEDAKHMIASETSRANQIIDGVVELKNFVFKMEEQLEA